MANLVKKRNKYFLRVRRNGKETTIPTKTGNKKEAERYLKIYNEREFLVNARLLKESELEVLDLQTAKDRFIRDRKFAGRRPSTIKSYELSLQNLIDANSPSIKVSVLSKKHLNRVIDFLHDQDKVPTDSTINIRIRSINAFMNWLLIEGYVLERIKLAEIRVDEQMPKFMTPKELEDLYAQVHNFKMLSTLKVYEGLGLRLSELHHSELKGDIVVIPAEYSKSRRERHIPMPPGLLEHYVVAMEKPFHAHTITHAFRKYADKAGLKDKTLHCMRHTYALRKLQETKDIVTVKELLGHADIKTTMIYTKFPPEYIRDMLQLEDPGRSRPAAEA